MNQTANYQLPQWEASDPVKREDFNDAMSKLDTALSGAGGVQLSAGYYNGNGQATRTIDLGVTPKAVGVWEYGSSQGKDTLTHGGVAVPGRPAESDIVEITNGGFIVRNSSGTYTANYTNHFYTYLAFY